MTGGVIGLAGAMVLGPRIGKYNKDGSPNAIPGHNIPMAMVGTLHPGLRLVRVQPRLTLAGTDLRIGVDRGEHHAGLARPARSPRCSIMWMRYGKPDLSMMCNGMLAGLVAITAPCAFVRPVGAVIIGAVAGVLVVWSVFFFERMLKIDDPVGAIIVHGVNGAWGVLSLGLFADGTYGDGWNGVAGTVTASSTAAPRSSSRSLSAWQRTLLRYSQSPMSSSRYSTRWSASGCRRK